MVYRDPIREDKAIPLGVVVMERASERRSSGDARQFGSTVKYEV